MFERIYIEIGNICNLSCSFCAGTRRPARQMSKEEFALVCQKIKGNTKYIYLHVMGEPLLHPHLGELLEIARAHQLPVCLTTNGVLLSEQGGVLLRNADIVHKVSISLHALEGNDRLPSKEYLQNAVTFSKLASQNGIYTVFRLWNRDSDVRNGKNMHNKEIERYLRNVFPTEWQSRPRGFRLAKNTFLEYDGVFTWPTDSQAEKVKNGFCYGLSSQLAVLVDGTVVPCCLDCNGELALGNLFTESLQAVLSAPRARAMREGFAKGMMIEPMCQKCTFARRFANKRMELRV